MSTMHGTKAGRHGETRSLITTARPGASADFNTRQVFYFVTMGFRVVCFLAMIWVPSPWRWALFFAAIILPGVAVMFANQADQRSGHGTMETTTGTHFSVTGSHIGELEEGPDRDDSTSGTSTSGTESDNPADRREPRA